MLPAFWSLAAPPRNCVARPGRIGAKASRRRTIDCANRCDIVLAGGLSMGGILALRLAQQRPEDVHGLLLYAPTLKLDGWAMPWHSLFLQYLKPTPLRLEFDLPERDPYGLKDERVRALVVSSMQSGDAGQAGVFSTPMRSFANFQRARGRGQTAPQASAPARAHRASSQRRHCQLKERPVPAVASGRAGRARWCWTTATTWSPWTSSATSWPSAPMPSSPGSRTAILPERAAARDQGRQGGPQ